ncbi:hypothetical protein [Streptomyces sp. URMC 123]|uniref:hypothetical protein n=1 Tax=Streptomyces sp. URMC 123 TaxID=3423403 RepID=UPI003F1C39BD
MNQETPPYRPGWVPADGHTLHRTGVHFDAVRIHGVRGEEAVAALLEETGGAAGPVVCEAIGFRWMYFLLPPGGAATRRWPHGVHRFGGARSAAYVGIPALTGNTWPLRWYSKPTERTPFVEPWALFAALVRERPDRSAEVKPEPAEPAEATDVPDAAAERPRVQLTLE